MSAQYIIEHLVLRNYAGAGRRRARIKSIAWLGESSSQNGSGKTTGSKGSIGEHKDKDSIKQLACIGKANSAQNQAITGPPVSSGAGDEDSDFSGK